MSPSRRGHDAPTRRRRPPPTHDRAGSDGAEQEGRPADEPEPEEPEPEEPEPDEPEPDEPEPEEPEPDEPEPEEDDVPEGDDEPRDERPEGGLDAHEAARRAVEHLTTLSHHAPEGVVGIDRDDGGWTVTVEVLEDAHVPSTSDVLAEYEVRLDLDGGLVSARRRRRYVRGRTEP